VQTQLGRDIREFPQLIINKEKDSIFDFEMEDFEIKNYNPHPAIRASIAV